MSILAEPILASLTESQASTYIHVSSVALLITDWFFTLDLEVAYSWNPPWNIGTVLFFLTRYLVFADTFLQLHRQVAVSIPAHVCAQMYTAEGLLITLGISISELILTIRVWAIWERRRSIKILLITVSIITASAGVIGYVLYGNSFTSNDTAGPTPTAPGCFTNSAGITLQWAYVPLLVHQVVISTMTVVKGVQHYRMGMYNTSLIHTFYQDGVSYYVVVIVLSALNLFMLHKNTVLLISIQRVLHSILTARMLLHLRQEVGTLHVMGQDPKALVPNANSGSGSPSRCPPIPDASPKTKSRVAGWFVRQDSQFHQRRVDLEV